MNFFVFLSVIGPCESGLYFDCDWSRLISGQCEGMENKVSFLLDQIFMVFIVLSFVFVIYSVFNRKYRKYFWIGIFVFLMILLARYGILPMRMC